MLYAEVMRPVDQGNPFSVPCLRTLLCWCGLAMPSYIPGCVQDKEQASPILTLEFATTKGETQKKVTTGAGLQSYRNREPMRLGPMSAVKDWSRQASFCPFQTYLMEFLLWVSFSRFCFPLLDTIYIFIEIIFLLCLLLHFFRTRVSCIGLYLRGRSFGSWFCGNALPTHSTLAKTPSSVQRPLPSTSACIVFAFPTQKTLQVSSE